MVKFQKGKSSKSIGPQVTEDLFFIPGSRPKDNQLEKSGPAAAIARRTIFYLNWHNSACCLSHAVSGLCVPGRSLPSEWLACWLQWRGYPRALGLP
jgi:hypothetical protein